MKTKLFILLILTFLSNLVWAKVYEINPQHSQVKFAIDYMSITTVEGHFTEFKGAIDFEPDTAKLKIGQIQIKAKSINTGDQKRDNHLRSKDFFKTDIYPELNVTLENLTTPVNQMVTAGALFQIKQITKELPLTIVYKGERKDPWGKSSHFFKIDGKINRKDFDLTWNRTIDQKGLLLGEMVSITGQFEVQLSGKKTPFSRYYIPATEALDRQAQVQRGEVPRGSEVVIEVPKAVVEAPKVLMNVPSEKKAPEGNLPLQLVIGFIGFIAITLISIWLKIKLLKYQETKSEAKIYFWEVIGDSGVLLIAFLYSVAFFKLLYP